MHEIGKLLMLIGVAITGIGAVLWKTGNLGFLKHLGHLPGDFTWEKAGTSFHFPLTTCLLLSVILSLIGWILRR